MNLQQLYVQYLPILRPILRIGPIVGGIVILAWRVRETRVPVTARAIVTPPLAMSTGLLMFAAPMTRVPRSWAIGAFFLGALVLSWPLARSTRLEPRDGVIYVKRSRAFMAILLTLLAVRLLLHDYIGHLVSPLQTAALFYLLALGMVVRWRLVMYRGYRALVARR